MPISFHLHPEAYAAFLENLKLVFSPLCIQTFLSWVQFFDPESVWWCGFGSLTQLGKESSGSPEGINWNKEKKRKKKKLTDSSDSSVLIPIDDTLPFHWNDDIPFAMVPVFRILESQYSRTWNSYDLHKRKLQDSPQCIFSDRRRARGKGESASSTPSSCLTASLPKRQGVQSEGWWITSSNSPSFLQCVEQRVVVYFVILIIG